MKKKLAIISGITGQDGSYLGKFLISKNYKVVGIDRFNSQNQKWRHHYLKIQNDIIYETCDLNDELGISQLVRKYKPDEFYNLAAHSFVKSSFDQPLSVIDVNAKAVVRILESIKQITPSTKFYQASTSEMFGGKSLSNLSLNSKFNPRSPYAYSKLLAHFATKNYREAYNIYACSGILFNHESVLRGEEFVTKKIIKFLVNLKEGKSNSKKLSLGNLYSKRDWGSAEEYVTAMWRILQNKKADDYIIGTGQSLSVKEFINYSMRYLSFKDFEWRGKGLNEKMYLNGKIVISIDPKFFRKTEVDRLKCNVNETYKKLKWKPKFSKQKLIQKLIDDEYLLQSFTQKFNSV